MTVTEISFGVVALLVALAVAFDFMNGFHDAANSIATVVSTGVLKPQQAIVFAAFFNVLAIAIFHLNVAAAALKTCEEIDRLESDADRVMRSAMSRLFREEKDVRELIKLRAIYELLESISDRCEDVANLIEGVVLENS